MISGALRLAVTALVVVRRTRSRHGIHCACDARSTQGAARGRGTVFVDPAKREVRERKRYAGIHGSSTRTWGVVPGGVKMSTRTWWEGVNPG